MTNAPQLQTSRVQWDARQPPATLPQLPPGTTLQLNPAGRLDAAHALAWRQRHPKPAPLTAVLDLPDAGALEIPAWLEALAPDVVEVRTPAWTVEGMAAVGWPVGNELLICVLRALVTAGQTAHVVLHVSDLTLPTLTTAALDALADEVGLPALHVILRPVLGAHAPRLDALARAVTALTLGEHRIQASRLWPACGLPASVDGVVAFKSEVAVARVAFAAACEGCPARAQDRCEGMAADLLAATLAAGGTWEGWATWAEEREPPEAEDEEGAP